MVSAGYVPLGRLGRIPLRMHLATPVGLFVFTGFSFNPILWVGFLFIVLIHELGHAALVRRYRLSVVSIDITGIGGVCRWAGHATPVQQSVIAWGGVLAQACLLVVTQLIASTVGLHGQTAVGQIATSLVAANVYLMALNLLPFPPLDGAKAWALFRWEHVRSWPRGVPWLRRTFLNLKLAFLRRRYGQHGRVPTAADIVRSKGPILRSGSDGDKPADKRSLN